MVKLYGIEVVNGNTCSLYTSTCRFTFEPPRGKTNNVVSEQVQHKPACTATEAGKKLDILELSRGGIVLSE